MGRWESIPEPTWDKEPNLGKLAAICEFYFEWGYKEAIIKRFTTVIWPPAVLRILRWAVLGVDAKAKHPGTALPITPEKKRKLRLTPIGTPSKLITEHFASVGLNSPNLSHDDDERLIVKIHSTRNHSSTDEILEYRLEIAPAQLVRLAESGIKGTRPPEDVDEWVDEGGHDDDGGGRGVNGTKLPPDPDNHIRLWMPAAIVRIVEPDLVEEFEQIQHRKRGRKAEKGRAKTSGSKGPSKRRTAGEDEDEELAPLESELPRLRPVGQFLKKWNSVQMPFPAPMSLNDVFGPDDPFKSIEEPFPSLAEPRHVAKKVISSFDSRSNKSPRISLGHMSPCSGRATLSYLSRDNKRNIDLHARSPSPLASRSTSAMIFPSLRSIDQPQVIEISSDESDAPASNSRPTSAKAGSQARPTSPINKYIRPKRKQIDFNHVDPNLTIGDVIDLT